MDIKIKYIDKRPVFIQKLKNYKNGITPELGMELTVSQNESKKLLNMKNGKKKCFELVKAYTNPKSSFESEEK